MKGIQTASEKERKQKRDRIVLSVIMLGILLTSTIGFAFLSGDGAGSANEQDPSDISSSKQQPTLLQNNGISFVLQTAKEEILKVPVALDYNINDFNGQILYVDIEDPSVFYEITSNLGKIARRINEACYLSCKENIPERNCEQGIIVWRESETNNVYQENNCIFIEGDVKSADAFLYYIIQKDIKV